MVAMRVLEARAERRESSSLSLRTKLLNRCMKINVYINDTLYKTIDLGNATGYNPKAITDLVFADKEAGLIPASLKLDESMAIRIERV